MLVSGNKPLLLSLCQCHSVPFVGSKRDIHHQSLLNHTHLGFSCVCVGVCFKLPFKHIHPIFGADLPVNNTRWFLLRQFLLFVLVLFPWCLFSAFHDYWLLITALYCLPVTNFRQQSIMQYNFIQNMWQMVCFMKYVTCKFMCSYYEVNFVIRIPVIMWFTEWSIPLS